MFLFNELDCKAVQVDESVRNIVNVTELLYSKLPAYSDIENSIGNGNHVETVVNLLNTPF